MTGARSIRGRGTCRARSPNTRVFLASGVLHDVPANGGDFLHARADYPLIVLFAPFGAVMLTTEAVGMDLSRRPEWVRASTNLSLLAAGFGVRR